MKYFLLCLFTLILSSCASMTGENLQKDCKEVGGGYWQCDKYQWWKASCNRWN